MTRLLTTAEVVTWLQALGTTALTTDSRQVMNHASTAFIAWLGAAVDGRQFVQQALHSGAVAALVEEVGLAGASSLLPEENSPQAKRVARCSDLKTRSGDIASVFYGHPSHHLRIVAFTGTNGKTSSSWWLAEAMDGAVVGTLGIGRVGIGKMGQVVSNGLTTPDPVLLQAQLKALLDKGCKVIGLEASSIGIAEARLNGTQIHTAVFTNFTQDHLDYHGSMEAYWQAKAALFDWPGLKAAVINIDDAQGLALLDRLAGKALDVWTVAIDKPARLQAVSVRTTERGLAFDVLEAGTVHPMQTNLVGRYNVSNLLGVLAAMRSLGLPLAACILACQRITPVPGRLEVVSDADQPLVVVDYAHTPDALEKVLLALRESAMQRGGKLWCIFGCGGERDATKRPVMGATARRHADNVVVTSDNPRSESPAVIISQILLGLEEDASVQVQSDRALAIGETIAQASANDVIVIAGKGHEDYQDIAGMKYPFSDQAHARSALATWGGSSMMTLALAHQLIPGSKLVGDASTVFTRVHTDTRSLQLGDLFVALKGDTFDAHDFLSNAKTSGAVAALAQHGLATNGLAGLEVEDSKAALGTLAKNWRQHLAAKRSIPVIPVIAVTGSNGKTTLTQMIASILRAWQGDAALATAGNFNNDIGVPLTLLRLNESHNCAVVELGMNHIGEIADLAAMTAPTVAVVNNAQREHQEFMGTVEAVARENGAVISSLLGDGVAVFPADDAYAFVWRALAGGKKILTFGFENADISASFVWHSGAWQIKASTPSGELTYALHMAGKHNVKNSLAAVTCALAAGVPLNHIQSGLTAFLAVAGRSRTTSLTLAGKAVTLVDDTYNANPDSVIAAIDMLMDLPAPRLFILGDMGEVGDQGPAFHAEVGTYAKARGVDLFWTHGELCRHAKGRHFVDMTALLNELAVLVAPTAVGEMSAQLTKGLLAKAGTAQEQEQETLPSQQKNPPAPSGHPPYFVDGGFEIPASILIKGSRFMKMERAVQHLESLSQERSHVA